MDTTLEQALSIMLRNWSDMSSSEGEEAESTADRFEDSFYTFIDVVRNWINKLEHKPQELDEALKLPTIDNIINLLPGPLYLNFETELELILEDKGRIDDEKYD